MKEFGWLLLIGGIAFGIYALNMDTSVAVDYNGYDFGLPERVNNLGLMNDRQNYLIVSATASVIGLILIYMGTKPTVSPILENHNSSANENTSVIDPTDNKENTNPLSTLEHLSKLKDNGVITPEEFNQQKEKILGSL